MSRLTPGSPNSAFEWTAGSHSLAAAAQCERLGTTAESAATFSGIAIDTSGTRFPLKVATGIPYLSGSEPDTWRCPVSVDPLHTQLRDIAAGDAFQALCLASRTALDLLRSFIERGGRVTFDGASDVPLDSRIPTVRKSRPSVERADAQQSVQEGRACFAGAPLSQVV